MSYGVVCRHGSDPALLWLWCRLAATAPIQPLAWEPPYATGAAQEMAKKTKKKKKKSFSPYGHNPKKALCLLNSMALAVTPPSFSMQNEALWASRAEIFICFPLDFYSGLDFPDFQKGRLSGPRLFRSAVAQRTHPPFW